MRNTAHLHSIAVPFAFALSGGWQFFLVAVGLLLLSLILNYTRAGSGINQRPYGNVYSSAPGAKGASVLSHDQSAASRYTRGTR
jgi:hypothetical protein